MRGCVYYVEESKINFANVLFVDLGYKAMWCVYEYYCYVYYVCFVRFYVLVAFAMPWVIERLVVVYCRHCL